jgi:hypothetical protein
MLNVEQLSAHEDLLDLLIKVLEYWRRQLGVVTRRSQRSQISITEMDLALCIVTTVQLARVKAMRRKMVQRGLANLLHEVLSLCH